MKVNTGTLLVVVACLATCSYLLTSMLTETSRSKFLAQKVKAKTADLMSREAELSKMSAKEQDLLAELVKKDREIKTLKKSLGDLRGEVEEKDTQLSAASELAKEREALLVSSKVEMDQALKSEHSSIDSMKQESEKLREQLSAAQAGMEAKRTILKTVKAELVQAQEAAKVAEAERSDASYQLKQCASTQSQMKQELADVRRKMEAQSASCAGCQLEMKENVTRADEQEADEQSLTLGANVTS